MFFEWNFAGPRLTVALCLVEALNFHVTVVPARTESDAGEKAKSSTVTVRAAAQAQEGADREHPGVASIGMWLLLADDVGGGDAVCFAVRAPVIGSASDRELEEWE